MRNIAVVEDRDSDAKRVTDYIERFSKETGQEFHVDRFASAADFLEGYRAVYAVVLMDIQMPKLNGMDGAMQLRRMDKFVVVYILCQLLFARRLKPEESGDIRNWKLLLLVSITVFVTQILSLWLNVEMWDSVLPRVYAIGGSVLLLIVQFNFFRESELEQKNRIIEQLMQQRNEQFAMSKENIDVINMKCHDLKKDLDLLLTVGDGAAREKLKAELSDSIMIYESEVRTGNEAIDVLLMDRGIYCNKNNIKLSYVVDGKLLGFMDTADVFSLIGNMLDNAIEREMQEREGERIITLRVIRRNGCIYVHIENYCSVPLKFSDGLPVTTKTDKTAHGFGTQSIRYVAEKYGGVVGMYSDNDYFNVDVLFAFSA